MRVRNEVFLLNLGGNADHIRPKLAFVSLGFFYEQINDTGGDCYEVI